MLNLVPMDKATEIQCVQWLKHTLHAHSYIWLKSMSGSILFKSHSSDTQNNIRKEKEEKAC